MEPPSTPFALKTSFPPVIFSYCTKTDGGRGEQRMWQIANFLKKHGIASFNGKQVCSLNLKYGTRNPNIRAFL